MTTPQTSSTTPESSTSIASSNGTSGASKNGNFKTCSCNCGDGSHTSTTTTNSTGSSSKISLCRYTDGPPIVLELQKQQQQQQQQQQSSSPPLLLRASALEAALTRRLAMNDDDFAIDYLPRFDCHWLDCRPRRLELVNSCLPSCTILGIVEDDYSNHHDDYSPNKPPMTFPQDPNIQLCYYRPVQQIPSNTSPTTCSPSCLCGICGNPSKNCHAKDREWKRRLFSQSTTRTTKTDNPSSCLNISWIDLRSTQQNQQNQQPLLTSPAGVLHWLRSLLGSYHDSSPWVHEEQNTATPNHDSDDTTSTSTTASTTNHIHPNQHDMVLLILPGKSDNDTTTTTGTSSHPPKDYKELYNFRVGNAAPDWFLHCVTQLDHLEIVNDDDKYNSNYNNNPMQWLYQKRPNLDAPSATMWIYKRLLPRDWLSTTTTRTMEDSSLQLLSGCLYETYYQYPKQSKEEEVDEPNVDISGTTASLDDADVDEPTIFHYPPIQNHNADQTNNDNNNNIIGPLVRIVGPPYLDLYHEFPHIASKLMTQANLQVFYQEAMAIPQWTPWPETQHYSQSTMDENSNTTIKNPWTVFPLCHCFPANDPSKLQWIPPTTRQCPKTCHILKTILGTTLRTALFSQLQPLTTLEPHTGWSDLANHVVRLHLPLVVPAAGRNQSKSVQSVIDQEQKKHWNDSTTTTAITIDEEDPQLCGVWVDGCVMIHRVGTPIVFDDSKIHRAFNYSSTESRIVLIVDLERPPHLPLGTAVGGHSEELDSFISQMQV